MCIWGGIETEYSKAMSFTLPNDLFKKINLFIVTGG